MNLLLDTHVAIWAVADDPRLPRSVRALINDPTNSISVSAVSIWEIAIKFPLARRGIGDMPFSSEEALGYFRQAGYTLLDTTPEHAVAVERLARLHGDPFDRLLLAQARHEPFKLVSGDTMIGAYGDPVIWP